MPGQKARTDGRPTNVGRKTWTDKRKISRGNTAAVAQRIANEPDKDTYAGLRHTVVVGRKKWIDSRRNKI